MVLGPNIEKVVPITRYGIPLASGETIARVPKMDVGKSPTFKQLNQWKMMYENIFFNPTDVIYKERDVCNVLQFEKVHHGCFNRQGGATSHTLKTGLRPRHHVHLNQQLHTALSKFPKATPSVFIKTNEETAKEHIEKPPDKKVMSHVSDEKKTAIDMPLASVSLLRRPRVEGFKVAPVDIESDLVEGWCTWVYITLPDDAPFTPESFYEKNYPLLLQKIQKRSAEEQEEQNSWRPLTRTPEISMTFFENFRLPSLSIDGATSSAFLMMSTTPPSYSSSVTSEVSLPELLTRSSSELMPSSSSPSIPSTPAPVTIDETLEEQEVVDPASHPTEQSSISNL